MFFMRSNHKIALITGASSGIGKALAENFAQDGYDVILAARSFSKMESQAAYLKERYNITATVIAADLESHEGAANLYKEIKNSGFMLSALANNAGYGTFGEFKDSTLQSELAMMQINMNTIVVLTKLFMPDLLATNGKIINTASTAAFQPGPYMAVYYATKAFVLSFSEAIAAELEGTGVTVTALCPGPTASGFQDKADMHASALVKNKNLPIAEEVAALGYRAMQRGQRVYIPGIVNWLMVQSLRFTPRSLVTKIVKAMSKPI
ncbi:MAG: SDR family oxidoreductase [Microcoleus sp. PH2017_29_MFU_D_A]|nr:SDR family oxidoreductase [Microcoleus sp. PH2017_07_MST_O_A]MCC3428196.1 SDR family oxidoreductase [Microcoleus sp. PH2017_01_SCD_O_A]MCC3431355.1 SDR family oxidoreductase [Microcoleus sp. PH2017_04_SCI_O_A]MCC3439870.1 SDR family oxidoreductase [Microcoleus sp. PH2017_05_CCC_O_A]MCC3457798.1 SDR family oxidoreductase [Microcoleus sp. PH2017_08_TRC_O_A]MCC3476208.1 SDR family oxidoreductase [Microcoleus sp. PH2017_13_LAR_U_A]MCC3488687.1 SDR family oxidoreductase [Microcoleus sp. PH2017_